ncbi:HD domain-containing protein, partial [Acinetobacter baumannii]
AERHRDQRRKGVEATPYINHPIRVARILVDAGIEDDIILAAAILHDTVEDTETTLDELSARFGPEVAAIVAEMTDDKTQTKAERKQCQID